MKSGTEALFEWGLQILERYQISKDLLQALFSARLADDDWVRVVQFVALHPESGGRAAALDAMLKLSERSRFPLGDWLSALAHFIAWLETRNESSQLGIMIEYISCAGASPEARLPEATLRALTAYHLEQHGFLNRRI